MFQNLRPLYLPFNFEGKCRRFQILSNVQRRAGPLMIDQFDPKRYQKKREDVSYKTVAHEPQAVITPDKFIGTLHCVPLGNPTLGFALTER